MDSIHANRFSQSMEVSTLYAYYGVLLTERQREALRLHYYEDWSLAEVAEYFGVTRQSVHELIIRSSQKLERYEKLIGSITLTKRISEQLHVASEELENAKKLTSGMPIHYIHQALEHIQQAIDDIDGRE